MVISGGFQIVLKVAFVKRDVLKVAFSQDWPPLNARQGGTRNPAQAIPSIRLAKCTSAAVCLIVSATTSEPCPASKRYTS